MSSADSADVVSTPRSSLNEEVPGIVGSDEEFPTHTSTICDRGTPQAWHAVYSYVNAHRIVSEVPHRNGVFVTQIDSVTGRFSCHMRAGVDWFPDRNAAVAFLTSQSFSFRGVYDAIGGAMYYEDTKRTSRRISLAIMFLRDVTPAPLFPYDNHRDDEAQADSMNLESQFRAPHFLDGQQLASQEKLPPILAARHIGFHITDAKTQIVWKTFDLICHPFEDYCAATPPPQLAPLPLMPDISASAEGLMFCYSYDVSCCFAGAQQPLRVPTSQQNASPRTQRAFDNDGPETLFELVQQARGLDREDLQEPTDAERALRRRQESARKAAEQQPTVIEEHERLHATVIGAHYDDALDFDNVDSKESMNTFSSYLEPKDTVSFTRCYEWNYDLAQVFHQDNLAFLCVKLVRVSTRAILVKDENLPREILRTLNPTDAATISNPEMHLFLSLRRTIRETAEIDIMAQVCAMVETTNPSEEGAEQQIPRKQQISEFLHGVCIVRIENEGGYEELSHLAARYEAYFGALHSVFASDYKNMKAQYADCFERNALLPDFDAFPPVPLYPEGASHAARQILQQQFLAADEAPKSQPTGRSILSPSAPSTTRGSLPSPSTKDGGSFPFTLSDTAQQTRDFRRNPFVGARENKESLREALSCLQSTDRRRILVVYCRDDLTEGFRTLLQAQLLSLATQDIGDLERQVECFVRSESGETNLRLTSPHAKRPKLALPPRSIQIRPVSFPRLIGMLVDGKSEPVHRTEFSRQLLKKIGYLNEDERKRSAALANFDSAPEILSFTFQLPRPMVLAGVGFIVPNVSVKKEEERQRCIWSTNLYCAVSVHSGPFLDVARQDVHLHNAPLPTYVQHERNEIGNEEGHLVVYRFPVTTPERSAKSQDGIEGMVWEQHGFFPQRYKDCIRSLTDEDGPWISRFVTVSLRGPFDKRKPRYVLDSIVFFERALNPSGSLVVREIEKRRAAGPVKSWVPTSTSEIPISRMLRDARLSFARGGTEHLQKLLRLEDHCRGHHTKPSAIRRMITFDLDLKQERRGDNLSDYDPERHVCSFRPPMPPRLGKAGDPDFKCYMCHGEPMFGDKKVAQEEVSGIGKLLQRFRSAPTLETCDLCRRIFCKDHIVFSTSGVLLRAIPESEKAFLCTRHETDMRTLAEFARTAYDTKRNKEPPIDASKLLQIPPESISSFSHKELELVSFSLHDSCLTVTLLLQAPCEISALHFVMAERFPLELQIFIGSDLYSPKRLIFDHKPSSPPRTPAKDDDASFSDNDGVEDEPLADPLAASEYIPEVLTQKEKEKRRWEKVHADYVRSCYPHRSHEFRGASKPFGRVLVLRFPPRRGLGPQYTIPLQSVEGRFTEYLPHQLPRRPDSLLGDGDKAVEMATKCSMMLADDRVADRRDVPGTISLKPILGRLAGRPFSVSAPLAAVGARDSGWSKSNMAELPLNYTVELKKPSTISGLLVHYELGRGTVVHSVRVYKVLDNNEDFLPEFVEHLTLPLTYIPSVEQGRFISQQHMEPVEAPSSLSGQQEHGVQPWLRDLAARGVSFDDPLPVKKSKDSPRRRPPDSVSQERFATECQPKQTIFGNAGQLVLPFARGHPNVKYLIIEVAVTVRRTQEEQYKSRLQDIVQGRLPVPDAHWRLWRPNPMMAEPMQVVDGDMGLFGLSFAAVSNAGGPIEQLHTSHVGCLPLHAREELILPRDS